MLKFMTSLALTLFAAATFVTVDAQAEFRPCIKGPKDYPPCPMASQRQPQLAKIRMR